MKNGLELLEFNTKEALNKSRHASCLHIFRNPARKLLEIHQVFLRRFHTILGAASAYEKSVCAICIPDLISTSLIPNQYIDIVYILITA